MKHYIVDTNILIEYFRDNQKAVTFLQSLSVIFISLITVGELYQGAKNKKELGLIKDFIQKHCKVIPLDSSTTNTALSLLENHTLSEGLLILDALIAACALEYSLTLITENARHFRFINNLYLEAWQKD